MILQLLAQALLASLVDAKAYYGSKSYSYSYSYSTYKPSYSSYYYTYSYHPSGTVVVSGGGGAGGLIAALIIAFIIIVIVCSRGGHHGNDGFVEHHTVTVVETKERVFPPGWNESMMPPMHPPGFEPGNVMQQGFAWCQNNHQMTWLNAIPYPGATGVECDRCKRDIAVAYWFHHCYGCESDMCQNCAGPFMRFAPPTAGYPM